MKGLLIVLAGLAAALVLPLAAGASGGTDSWGVTIDVSPAAVAVGETATLTVDVVAPSESGYGTVFEYYGAGCTGAPVWTPTLGIGHFTHAMTPTEWDRQASGGAFSFRAAVYNNGDALKGTSACVTLNVTKPVVPSTPTVSAPIAEPRGEDGIFLCYSTFQVDPGVWKYSVAQKLIQEGYWAPHAITGNLPGGTNVGRYHLVCNLATGQAAGDQFVGAGGDVSGASVHSLLVGILGWYPVVK